MLMQYCPACKARGLMRQGESKIYYCSNCFHFFQIFDGHTISEVLEGKIERSLAPETIFDLVENDLARRAFGEGGDA